MIVLTSRSWDGYGAEIHVLKANYEAHRLDVCAEAAVVSDIQYIYRHHEHRIEEILPANGFGAVYYIFNISSDGFLHFFSYNPETNTCETRRVVKNDGRVLATHWHDGVFSNAEWPGKVRDIFVRRYYPASDKTESVRVEKLDAR